MCGTADAQAPHAGGSLDPQGTFTYSCFAPAERPVPVAVAARATHRVPLPAAVRPAAARRRCSTPCNGCRTRCAPTSTWRWQRRRSCPTRTATPPRSIDEISKFTRENWLPGGAQRFGNTKTFGVLRAEFTVLDGPSRPTCGTACSPSRAATRRTSGSPVRAPTRRPTWRTSASARSAIKVMGVAGPKLMEDESATQDLILVSPASFVTPDIRENATLQRWVRAKAPLGYLINRRPFRPAALGRCSCSTRRCTRNPLEVQYYSNVPFLLGDGQAVQYSLKPTPRGPQPDPDAARRRTTCATRW